MVTFNKLVIDNAASYDALLADHCLANSITSIEGIDRHARFETLTSAQIASLNEWFLKNGTVVVIRVNSVDFALHILGAKEVDPAKSPFNLERGKGKDKTYYWCQANAHNRIVKPANLGSLTKEGLIFDMVNQYYGVGPAAHIDAWGWILSLQHRLIAYILGSDERGEDLPAIDILTIVGMPPQLAATLDRGASKTKQDQEFIDREQFTVEFLHANLEYVPENVEKLRNELAGYLVTCRNNVWSRLHGTGYHPSGPNSPSTRQALAMQSCFAEVEHGDALQLLLVHVWSRSVGEDGKKGFWVPHLSVPMVACAIVLASNKDAEQWHDGQPLSIDKDVTEAILDALGQCSAEGHEGYSSYLREIAKIKKQPKKPSGLDRWVFWGLVSATQGILDDTYDANATYFPSVTDSLVKKLKAGKLSYPIFGGMDCGPIESE